MQACQWGIGAGTLGVVVSVWKSCTSCAKAESLSSGIHAPPLAVSSSMLRIGRVVEGQGLSPVWLGLGLLRVEARRTRLKHKCWTECESIHSSALATMLNRCKGPTKGDIYQYNQSLQWMPRRCQSSRWLGHNLKHSWGQLWPSDQELDISGWRHLPFQ